MPHKHYPSLLLIASSDQARWWRVESDTAEELAYLEDAPATYSDREGYFRAAGGGRTYRSGEPDVLNRRRAEDLHQHLRRIGDETVRLWRIEAFRHLCCAVPKELQHLVANELHRRLAGIVVHTLPANRIHASNTREIHRIFLQSVRIHLS